MKFYLLFCIFSFSLSANAQWVQSSLNASLGRSLYSDGTKIYAATSEGVFYTADTGEPWFSIGPQNQDIFAVITSGNKIIAGSGAGNGIFISTDNGQSWYNAPSMAGKSVYTFAKNSSYIFAGTWGQGIFRSSDNGESWEAAGLAQKGINELLSVVDTIFASSPDLYSKIYFSTDNGNTWGSGSLGYPASDVHGLFYNEGKLFACDFGLWASTDMGQSWYLQYGVTFDSTGYPIDVMIFKSVTEYNNYLIASVMFESILISSDNGVSWVPFNEGLINDWTFADVEINGSYLWALRGMFGNAYRRPVSDLVTSVDELPSGLNNFYLGQNYPNPFNPSTTIVYNLNERTYVRLTVYNAVGEEVLSLVNDMQDKGIHKVQFDAGKMTSGIYFYKLTAGGYNQTKKMVLLK